MNEEINNVTGEIVEHVIEEVKPTTSGNGNTMSFIAGLGAAGAIYGIVKLGNAAINGLKRHLAKKMVKEDNSEIRKDRRKDENPDNENVFDNPLPEVEEDIK